MRLRNVTGSKDMIAQSQYVIHEPQEHKGKWSEVFGNDRPIHIEIGMGKGKFIMGMAQAHPDINYIGIEKYSTVLLRAIQKMEENELPNVVFIRMDAENIEEVFDKDEVDRIYLNFSDPWPKKKHAKRRLTSPIFLNLYDNIFKGNPHIVQKTDNIGLFAYSLETLSNYGYKFNRVSLDLANEDIDNVCTEYEKKFMSLGIKINYVDAVKK